VPSDAVHEAMTAGAPMPTDVPPGTLFVARGVHTTFASHSDYLAAYARRCAGWLQTMSSTATIMSPERVFIVPEFAGAVNATVTAIEDANALFVLVSNRRDAPYDGLCIYVARRIAAGEHLALGRGIVSMVVWAV
jgi:hypothetical protein